jgi:hypothetical protein
MQQGYLCYPYPIAGNYYGVPISWVVALCLVIAIVVTATVSLTRESFAPFKRP